MTETQTFARPMRMCAEYALGPTCCVKTAVGNHSTEALSDAPRTLEWVGRALDGEQLMLQSGCQTEVVSVNVQARKRPRAATDRK